MPRTIMTNVYIARQPIYNRRLQVEGYELLFRSGEENRADVHDRDRATSTVLRNAFMEIGLGHLVGEKPAFINFTRNLLLDRESFPYPYEKVVLELPAYLEPDAEVVAAVADLRRRGCRFALDNFGFSDPRVPLVDLVDYIKLNLQELGLEKIPELMGHLGGCEAKLLAHCVESQQEYVACRELGIDHFQGFFFCRPEIVKGRRLPASRLSTIRLLSQLQSPDVTIEELEKIIAQDVSLSYRLLRYLNSVQFGLVSKIDSIRHAVSYLGLDNLRVWASVILLARIDEKPVELLKTSLVRGKMCELLGRESGESDHGMFFMVGLFSTLEALLDLPIGDILQDLPLAEGIKLALLGYAGSPGEALACVLAYERGEWDAVDDAPYPGDTVSQAYLRAIAWAEETIGEVAG
ncbi:hypothetical protein B5V00_01990 [Geothermobacter hydrogeniphilus]|uniref:HDOD domain-containing protein n=2 Tax=Geothermobacter hydrogeniphilus TaxID=1969733 RepID=A0A1X0YCN5_9BACT|nr:hypothetical protein B5V00_01990 [Geothermobacter hydrogeniphilus]